MKGNHRHGHKTVAHTTAEYEAWRSLIQRCTNPKVKNYAQYGGRGIKVCARWLADFRNFLADMGLKPGPGRGWSIDRKDNDGDYEPSNCRWATKKEQMRNFSCNRSITFEGKTQCISAWAEERGLSTGVLEGRLSMGWSIERTLNTLVRAQGPRAPVVGTRLITHAGRTQSVSAWAKELQISPNTLYYRVGRQWPLDRIFSTPR